MSLERILVGSLHDALQTPSPSKMIVIKAAPFTISSYLSALLRDLAYADGNSSTICPLSTHRLHTPPLCKMNRLYSYLVGGCLLVGASAFTSDAPVMGDALPEHYCFPKYGAPFHDLERRPSVTIMYQGTTVTATPFAAVGCRIASSNVPPVATGGSLLTSTPSMPLGSPTSIAISSQSAVRSYRNISSGSIRESQGPAMGSWTSSFVASRNPNLATGSGGVAPTSGASPSIRPSETSLGAGSSPGPVVTTPSQAPSAGPGGIVPSNVFSPTRPAAPTSLPTDESQNESNTTLPLPPGAVDALELAQFLKNLGVSIFNASSEQATGTSQSAVLANMSTVRSVVARQGRAWY